MPDKTVRQNVVARARSLVVKVGSGSLTDPQGRLDGRAVGALAGQVASAAGQGRSVTLVTSGAIAAGMGELEVAKRPRTLPGLQALAAVGQGQLMRSYHDAFARRGLRVAQVLITRGDFEDRTRYVNIRNTLTTLLDMSVVPILNENDAVAVDEIRYGENDVIAAHVANMLAAEVLVLLTNVEGVLKDGQRVPVIRRVDDQARALVEDRTSRLGTGGMATKLQAAGMVTRAGEVAVIARAKTPKVLTRLLAGEEIGTVFLPAERKMSSRRRWIGQASRPEGRLMIDEGAVRALTRHGKSLLPSGIVGVEGAFEKGATVSLVGPGGEELGRGLSNYSADQVRQIMGLRSSQIAPILGEKLYDEVVHRNNMTLR
jgi:glutamate 5-kinase